MPRSTRDTALRTNRRAWDATVRRHRAFRGDEAERLARGEDPADLTALGGAMRREIGDLAGRDVLHAMCNHGAVTVALARGARSVLGVDFSAEAVREARDLAARTGSPAEFQRAEVLRFLATTRRRFDAVVAAWGVTCWIPDMERFARGVARVLRPGGFVHLLDGHPMANTATGVGDPGDGYFASADGTPRRERWAFDYYGAGHGRRVDIVWWQWPVGDVVTAFCDAGLVVEFVHEFEGTHPQYYGTGVALDVNAAGDAGTLPGRRGVLPLAFSVRARREGPANRNGPRRRRRGPLA
jgi:SAM-dependent methyltransferase